MMMHFSEITTKLFTLFHQIKNWLGWQLRRPMVRFGLFALTGFMLLGYGGWQLWLERKPENRASAELAQQIARTPLEKLLRPPQQEAKETLESARQWISCSDIRRVLTDTDRVYVGCRGGVLVTTLQGDLIKQYSQADGLPNDIITDLQLVGRQLFVGSQDGVAVINLDTHQITPLREREGLVNGSNINLAADGDVMWVGTFDGLSRIDTKTLQITNYKTELLSEASKFSVHAITVSQKAVYISLIASAYSPGGLVRFDKKTQTFTQFPASQFFRKNLGQSSESINYLNVAVVGDDLVLQDDMFFWSGKDSQNMQLNPLPAIADTLKKLAQVPYPAGMRILGTINDQVVIRFFNDATEHLAIYTPKTKALRLAVPQDPLFGVARALSLARPSNQLASVELKLPKGRPYGFGKILAAIDDQIWFSAQDGIWTLAPKTNQFVRRIEWNEQIGTPDQMWFVPIAGTRHAMIGQQICGMGCIEPSFWLVSWPEQTVLAISLPTELKSAFQMQVGDVGALDYAVVRPPTFDKTNQQLVFSLPTARVSFNPVDQQWRVIESNDIAEDEESSSKAKQVCYPLFVFASDSQTFQTKSHNCANELGIFRIGDYALAVGADAKNPQDNWLVDGTGKKLSIIPADAPIYSPFDGWTDYIGVKFAALDQESVWLGHNRGVARYFPLTQTWQLYTAKTGLAGPVVEDMVVMDEYLVTISRGGMAVVPKLPASTATP